MPRTHPVVTVGGVLASSFVVSAVAAMLVFHFVANTSDIFGALRTTASVFLIAFPLMLLGFSLLGWLLVRSDGSEP